MMADANEREGFSAIVLVVVLIAVAAYLLFFGLQTLIYFEARYWGSREPELAVTPQPLNLATTPVAQSTHLEFFNYQCEAPWKGPAQTSQGPDFIENKFDSGAAIRVFLPEAQADALKSFKGETPEQQERMTNLFGPHPFDSNFDLYAAIYSAPPSQASPFMPRVDAERLNTLLLWKLAFDTQLPGGIFRFESGPNRGLQFGDPLRSPAVVLRAFNERDRQFKFLITMKESGSAKLTQNDINQIITTLKPVPLPGQ